MPVTEPGQKRPQRRTRLDGNHAEVIGEHPHQRFVARAIREQASRLEGDHALLRRRVVLIGHFLPDAAEVDLDAAHLVNAAGKVFGIAVLIAESLLCRLIAAPLD